MAPESFNSSQDRDDVKTLMERLDLEQMKGRGSGMVGVFVEVCFLSVVFFFVLRGGGEASDW